MALSKVKSLSLAGLNALPVEVEVDIRAGLPAFTIVGLPDKAIEESKERIKSAITNSGFQFPTKKVVVNLAPAHIKKEGSWFDLPIALGILLAGGQLQEKSLDDFISVGELALDGSIRFCPGVLIAADSVKKDQNQTIIIPLSNYFEASLVNNLEILASDNLFELVTILRNEKIFTPPPKPTKAKESDKNLINIEDIKGQDQAKRAMVIALSGGHNILMYGPPGTGKSLLAKTAISLLPELEYSDAIEVTKIYSLIGNLNIEQPLVDIAPFRSPHHSSSHISLLGGGANPLPGEITLAHRGVLFLDELPEFTRQTLEGLRQPLEDGKVSIARAKAHLEYPAKFALIAAMNPCPCGYYGDNKRQCSCAMGNIQNYLKKISGPILDRFDIFIKLPRLSQEELLGKSEGLTSLEARKSITQAQNIARNRQKHLNKEISIKDIEKSVELDPDGQKLLLIALDKFNLSPRSYHKVIKIGRTIADLDNSRTIKQKHIAEALQYRPPAEIQ